MVRDYKKDAEELKQILYPIVRILKSEHEDGWGRFLFRLHEACEYVENEEDIRDIRREILSIYGGMGSFNDLCLGSNGNISPQNEEFDRLSTLLFSTVLKQKTRKLDTEFNIDTLNKIFDFIDQFFEDKIDISEFMEAINKYIPLLENVDSDFIEQLHNLNNEINNINSSLSAEETINIVLKVHAYEKYLKRYFGLTKRWS